MPNATAPCYRIKTNKDKFWPYEEYYLGNKDVEDRRSGDGENHWTGPASIEWYTGRFLRDTMHGKGDYRWRYLGPEGLFVTYEGAFFVNKLHGYGTMSYPDGRVFRGLYHGNVRWGPGVLSHADLHADVGLWRGRQLVRLAWRPAASPVVPDLMANPIGNMVVEPHRLTMTPSVKTIGEVNSALDLLKSYGIEPILATKHWPHLYAKHCTDMMSVICHRDLFERAYYGDTIHSLTEKNAVPEVIKVLSSQDEGGDDESSRDNNTYFAWNNNPTIVHMMKHCYTCEYQRLQSDVGIKLARVISGPRNRFRQAGKHETHCRTLLMASYLGHVVNVVDMINEYNVYADIADMQGNSALMYATCGNQHDIMHFLVEAAADVNGFNDACCTPLAVALILLATAENDISRAAAVQSLLPSIPPGPKTLHGKGELKDNAKVIEWEITRDLPHVPPPTMLLKVPSLLETNEITNRNRKESLKYSGNTGKQEQSQSKLENGLETNSSKLAKTKSQITLKQDPYARQKSPPAVVTTEEDGEAQYHSETNIFEEDQRLYRNLAHEYQIRVNNLFFEQQKQQSVPYLFNIRDMVKLIPEDAKKPFDTAKHTNNSKLKMSSKNLQAPSKLLQSQYLLSSNSIHEQKIANINTIKQTILQLMSDGADPKLVRCPQPALVIGIVTRDADIIRNLVQHGADVNENYPELLGYYPLDIAICQPLNQDTRDVVRSLLECGARADHRLPYESFDSSNVLLSSPGPTLLHVVLELNTKNDLEAQIRKEVLQLLLQYGSDPLGLFRDHSPLYQALTRHRETLPTFIESPNTNLNGIVNSSNENVLITMFNLEFFKAIELERLQILENLLDYGADPLLECESGEIKYQNLFVYAKQILESNKPRREGSPEAKITSGDKGKASKKGGKDQKVSKDKKGGKDEKAGKDRKGGKDDKGTAQYIVDYSLALDLAKDSARIMHTEWIQGRLVKELALIVDKYKHRSWHMIIKEHKSQLETGLWVTPQVCLEMWHSLLITRQTRFEEHTTTLRLLLCIVEYYNTKHLLSPKLKIYEKEKIDAKISDLMRTYKINTILEPTQINSSTRFSTNLKLGPKSEKKFNVCFECSIPLTDDIIPCAYCGLVSFCNFHCMHVNVRRINSHPCSPYLKDKYFPVLPEGE